MGSRVGKKTESSSDKSSAIKGCRTRARASSFFHPLLSRWFEYSGRRRAGGLKTPRCKAVCIPRRRTVWNNVFRRSFSPLARRTISNASQPEVHRAKSHYIPAIIHPTSETFRVVRALCVYVCLSQRAFFCSFRVCAPHSLNLFARIRPPVYGRTRSLAGARAKSLICFNDKLERAYSSASTGSTRRGCGRGRRTTRRLQRRWRVRAIIYIRARENVGGSARGYKR